MPLPLRWFLWFGFCAGGHNLDSVPGSGGADEGSCLPMLPPLSPALSTPCFANPIERTGDPTDEARLPHMRMQDGTARGPLLCKHLPSATRSACCCPLDRTRPPLQTRPLQGASQRRAASLCGRHERRGGGCREQETLSEMERRVSATGEALGSESPLCGSSPAEPTLPCAPSRPQAPGSLPGRAGAVRRPARGPAQGSAGPPPAALLLSDAAGWLGGRSWNSVAKRVCARPGRPAAPPSPPALRSRHTAARVAEHLCTRPICPAFLQTVSS